MSEEQKNYDELVKSKDRLHTALSEEGKGNYDPQNVADAMDDFGDKLDKCIDKPLSDININDLTIERKEVQSLSRSLDEEREEVRKLAESYMIPINVHEENAILADVKLIMIKQLTEFINEAEKDEIFESNPNYRNLTEDNKEEFSYDVYLGLLVKLEERIEHSNICSCIFDGAYEEFMKTKSEVKPL